MFSEEDVVNYNKNAFHGREPKSSFPNQTIFPIMGILIIEV